MSPLLNNCQRVDAGTSQPMTTPKNLPLSTNLTVFCMKLLGLNLRGWVTGQNQQTLGQMSLAIVSRPSLLNRAFSSKQVKFFFSQKLDSMTMKAYMKKLVRFLGILRSLVSLQILLMISFDLVNKAFFKLVTPLSASILHTITQKKASSFNKQGSLTTLRLILGTPQVMVLTDSPNLTLICTACLPIESWNSSELSCAGLYLCGTLKSKTTGLLELRTGNTSLVFRGHTKLDVLISIYTLQYFYWVILWQRPQQTSPLRIHLYSQLSPMLSASPKDDKYGNRALFTSVISTRGSACTLGSSAGFLAPLGLGANELTSCEQTNNLLSIWYFLASLSQYLSVWTSFAAFISQAAYMISCTSSQSSSRLISLSGCTNSLSCSGMSSWPSNSLGFTTTIWLLSMFIMQCIQPSQNMNPIFRLLLQQSSTSWHQFEVSYPSSVRQVSALMDLSKSDASFVGARARRHWKMEVETCLLYRYSLAYSTNSILVVLCQRAASGSSTSSYRLLSTQRPDQNSDQLTVWQYLHRCCSSDSFSSETVLSEHPHFLHFKIYLLSQQLISTLGCKGCKIKLKFDPSRGFRWVDRSTF